MTAKKRQIDRATSHFELMTHIAGEQLKQEREAAWERLSPELKRLWDLYHDETLAAADRCFEANCKAIDEYFHARGLELFES